MSVLIRGMQMPGSCRKCQVMVGTFCQILNIDVDPFYDGETRRNRKCPLVEIPEKHGRLIDADEMNRLWSGCYFEGSIKPLLDARPTVIEAEGEEEVKR